MEDARFGGAAPCRKSRILDGAYDGRDIGFVVTQRGVQMRFAGTAQNATISGTFATDCDAMDGTWTVTRTSR